MATFQQLSNCGINPFGVELVAESLLQHPRPVPVDFVLEVNRKDCAGWAGVRFKLDPIPEGQSVHAVDAARVSTIGELRKALDESVKLQSHYAQLLNGYDGGQRMEFASADAWIERLRVCRREAGD
jgi:hypothetical protein